MTENDLTPQAVLAQLEAYALGALEPAEAAAIDAYFAAQQRLDRRLTEVDHAISALAQATPHNPLPTSAKADLMARVARDLAGDSPPAASRPVAVALDPRQSFADWLRGLFTGRGPWPAAAGLALAAVLVLAAWTLQLGAQLRAAADGQTRLMATNQALTEAVAQRDEALAAAETALAETTTALQNTQLALNAAEADLAGMAADQLLLANVSAASQALILHSESGGDLPRGAFYIHENRGQIVVHGLDPLPADRAYQLWLVRPDGSQVSAGLIDVQTRAEATWTDVAIASRDFIAAGITIEPAGGSPNPSGTMLLQSDFQS